MPSHSFLCSAWAALSVPTFFILLSTQAPYGKHHRSGWGPNIDGRLAWFVQELISPVVYVLCFIRNGSTQFSPPALIFCALWICHYFNRTVVYCWQRPYMAESTVLVMTLAILFNVVNGYLCGTEAGSMAPHLQAEWSAWRSPFYRIPLRILVGLLLFICGAVINIHSDLILKNLRKSPEDRSYYIPTGGLFSVTSSPNYFGEWMEWTGYAIGTWTLSGWCFCLWTFANLAPRAVANHEWYTRKFENYPKRAAFLPFLW